jgi:lipopolysaccharide transport system permease protein
VNNRSPDQEQAGTAVDQSIRQEVFSHEHLTEIAPEGRSFGQDLREIWAYRDLLALLVRRDVSIRYKQSSIGIAWAVLQPAVLVAIFSIVFGRFAKLPSEGYPYPLFVMCALLPWLYFSRSMVGVSESMVASSRLVSKVYFPRLILPLSKAAAGLVDFAIALVLLAGVMAWYRVVPGVELLLLPAFIAIAMLTALAIGLWLTALNVRYRDVMLLVPFVVQVWMYLSPIAYSVTLVPERWRLLYSLNPLVGVVEGFRWALLGKAPPDLTGLVLSLAIILFMFAGGVAYFRRVERTFADII